MKEQNWTSTEIRDLLLLCTELRNENENLKAMIIAFQAKLANEEAKVTILKRELWKLN